MSEEFTISPITTISSSHLEKAFGMRKRRTNSPGMSVSSGLAGNNYLGPEERSIPLEPNWGFGSWRYRTITYSSGLAGDEDQDNADGCGSSAHAGANENAAA